MNTLYEFDLEFIQKTGGLVAGVDEVGRGPLAGPVVAASVIFSEHEIIEGINDSKKLSEKKREELFPLIKKRALAVTVGIKNNHYIDKHNIRTASLHAMQDAIEHLNHKPSLILVDGRDTIPSLTIEQKSVIKGDSKSYTIAAASIVAKVIRDRIMMHHHKKHPEYYFSSHKGYGTKKHLEAIKQHGSLPIHRFSFSGVN
ncbi:MAG: ribonuclease HII [Nitrospinae bacterium]|nr:ribonuclease HII [Nitrospinota bacterium]